MPDLGKMRDPHFLYFIVFSDKLEKEGHRGTTPEKAGGSGVKGKSCP